MDLVRLRAAVRFDSGWWRRFAEFGCVHSPEWWRRGSPPVIAAIIFSIACHQRAAVLCNQRQVRGPRGWLREHWQAYRVFAECARSMTESLEQWGPHPPRVALDVPEPNPFRAALAEGRGLVVPTTHFGGWEVGACFLSDLGRPVNLVMAHEPNPTARDFIHRLHTRHGVNVIYSDRSLFAGLPVLQAPSGPASAATRCAHPAGSIPIPLSTAPRRSLPRSVLSSASYASVPRSG